MGVESYFIDAKLNKKFNLKQLATFFVTKSFDVSPHIKKYPGIFFSKKVISDSGFVVNGIVVCELFERNDVSLQACFSCYEKSVNIMAKVLLAFRDNNILQYAYYGDRHFNLQGMNKSDIIDMINDIYSKKYNNFLNNYTKKEVEVLPNEFFRYYNKHRKDLK